MVLVGDGRDYFIFMSLLLTCINAASKKLVFDGHVDNSRFVEYKNFKKTIYANETWLKISDTGKVNISLQLRYGKNVLTITVSLISMDPECQFTQIWKTVSVKSENAKIKFTDGQIPCWTEHYQIKFTTKCWSGGTTDPWIICNKSRTRTLILNDIYKNELNELNLPKCICPSTTTLPPTTTVFPQMSNHSNNHSLVPVRLNSIVNPPLLISMVTVGGVIFAMIVVLTCCWLRWNTKRIRRMKFAGHHIENMKHHYCHTAGRDIAASPMTAGHPTEYQKSIPPSTYPNAVYPEGTIYTNPTGSAESLTSTIRSGQVGDEEENTNQHGYFENSSGSVEPLTPTMRLELRDEEENTSLDANSDDSIESPESLPTARFDPIRQSYGIPNHNNNSIPMDTFHRENDNVNEPFLPNISEEYRHLHNFSVASSGGHEIMGYFNR